MTHITITIRRDGEEDYPIVRTMDYPDKAAAVADSQGIVEFITNYAR